MAWRPARNPDPRRCVTAAAQRGPAALAAPVRAAVRRRRTAQTTDVRRGPVQPHVELLGLVAAESVAPDGGSRPARAQDDQRRPRNRGVSWPRVPWVLDGVRSPFPVPTQAMCPVRDAARVRQPKFRAPAPFRPRSRAGWARDRWAETLTGQPPRPGVAGVAPRSPPSADLQRNDNALLTVRRGHAGSQC